jgi:hypothetical protein
MEVTTTFTSGELPLSLPVGFRTHDFIKEEAFAFDGINNSIAFLILLWSVFKEFLGFIPSSGKGLL